MHPSTTSYVLYQEEESPAPVPGIPPVQPDGKTGTPREGEATGAVQKASTGIIGGPDDDLTLRASLYGVLFQSFADKVCIEHAYRLKNIPGYMLGVYIVENYQTGRMHGVLLNHIFFVCVFIG